MTKSDVNHRICERCDGCGKIASDEEGTPWKYWEDLPFKSAAAITLGVVSPLICPNCSGVGKIEITTAVVKNA